MTYQPDWIVEAMGLQADHARRGGSDQDPPRSPARNDRPDLPAHQGRWPDLFPDHDRLGQTRKVNEFRVISADGKTMIAQATIKKYRDLPVAGPTSEESSTAARETCSIPENIVLEWKREQTLARRGAEGRRRSTSSTPASGRPCSSSRRLAGYARVNLAELARQKDPRGSTAVRETIPVPEPRSRVRLNPPLQIRGDDAAAKTSRRQDQAVPKSAMLLPVLDLDVVDAPVPTAPDSPADRSGGTALAITPGTSMER